MIDWAHEVEKAATDNETFEQFRCIVNARDPRLSGQEWLSTLSEYDSEVVDRWLDQLVDWALETNSPTLRKAQRLMDKGAKFL